MKVVDDVVTRRADLTRRSQAWSHAAAFENDDVRGVWMVLQDRRDPVFDENVDLGVWHEAL